MSRFQMGMWWLGMTDRKVKKGERRREDDASERGRGWRKRGLRGGIRGGSAYQALGWEEAKRTP